MHIIPCGEVADGTSGEHLLNGFLLSRSLWLINKTEATHFSATTRTFTSIDLSFTDPTLLPFISWKVIENPYGSDHFPIILEFQTPAVTVPTRSPRWKFDEANWSAFKEATLLACSSFDEVSIDYTTEHITKHVLEAAIIAIPMTSTHLPRRPKPWWNDDCRIAASKTCFVICSVV